VVYFSLHILKGEKAMIHLELPREEIQVIIELLDTSIADLRTEVRQTDNHDYKAMLQQREVLLKKIHAELVVQISLHEPML
jgi:hypothetical protein